MPTEGKIIPNEAAVEEECGNIQADASNTPESSAQLQCSYDTPDVVHVRDINECGGKPLDFLVGHRQNLKVKMQWVNLPNNPKFRTSMKTKTKTMKTQ